MGHCFITKATTDPSLVFDTTTTTTTTTTTPPPPTTTESPIHHDFFCDVTSMSVHIPIHLLPNSKLTLRDPVCVLKQVGTNYVLTFKFDECGTSLSYFTDVVYITNAVTVHKNLGSLNSPIVVDTDFTIPLKCSLNRSALVEGSFQTVTREPIVEKEDKTDTNKYLLYVLREFKTEKYEEEITDYPVQIPINREIFLELSVNKSKPGLGIEIDRCYATPTTDPKDTTSYTLINKGCPATAVTHLVASSTHTKRRFKIQAFHFSGSKNDHDKVYIHCQVKYCLSYQCEDVDCSKQRGKRSSRSISRVNKPRYTRRARGNERLVAVSIGPFEIL